MTHNDIAWKIVDFLTRKLAEQNQTLPSELRPQLLEAIEFELLGAARAERQICIAIAELKRNNARGWLDYYRNNKPSETESILRNEESQLVADEIAKAMRALQ